MSEHRVTLKWERGGAEFSYQKYPRDHTWAFDGGHTMTATAAPAYLGNPASVDLHPKITWRGDRIPSAEQLDKMHHAAHENCFIANSVKTEVTVTNFRDA